ncbi:hypothetical protein J7643_01960 [bacterium]|nr:hypothetical protein [bacterium]
MRARYFNLCGVALLLASLTAGCTSIPTTATLWAPGSSLGLVSGGGGKGENEGMPVTGVTSALYQTEIGPIAWKGVQLATMTAGSPKLWNAPSDRYGMALAVASKSIGWAAGAGIVRYEAGNGWTTEATDMEAALSPTAPSSQRVVLTDIAVTPAGDVGFAVGTKGTVLKYNAVSKTWAKQQLSEAVKGKNFGSLKVFAADDVWVAGETLLHYDGTAWTEHVFAGGVSGLAANAPNNVWISTTDGLHRWNGTTWEHAFPVDGRTVGAPRIVQFGDKVVGMAVESGVPMGEVYVLTETTWSRETVTIPREVAFDTVVLADENTAYAKTYDNSGVWKYDLKNRVWSRFSD